MQLRPYQQSLSKSACSKLQQLGLVYLAMETRTGKTLTALHAADLYGAKTVLFITKKKAIGSILSDYKTLAPAFRLTVINYESVMKEAALYDLAIIDEAHSLGTFPKPSKRYKEIKSIVFGIPVILMSATPSPESYSQLYHQFTINKYHSWNKAGNFYKWAAVYVEKSLRFFYGREINDYSNARLDLIQKKTSDYFLTYTQQEAGFTQVVKEKVLICKMSYQVAELIDRLNKDLIVRLEDGDVLGDTAVKLMSKVHQLSSGTVIFEDGTCKIIDKGKALFVRNLFEGQKIAIFYKFKAELELLKSVFTNYTEVPEVFQDQTDTTFLGQFQSAREGIRLDSADALVFFNIDFSYLSYEQSRNRIISKERDRVTPLYFVFSDSGIEQKIYNVVKSKQDYTYSHYKKDYGKRHTTPADQEGAGRWMVRVKSDHLQQAGVSGPDAS